MGTRSYRSPGSAGEGQLWATALAVSLLLNVLILGLLGFSLTRKSEKEKVVAKPVEVVEERVVVFVPPVVAVPEVVPEEEAPAEAIDPRFARTSEEQRASRPDRPAFIGERDTLATSDAAPDADAPEMPSQKGEEPRDENDIETTQSDFQDGPDALAPMSPPPAPAVPEVAPSEVAEASEAEASEAEEREMPEAGEVVENAGEAEEIEEGAREALAAAMNPVDVPVSPEEFPEMPEAVEPKMPEEGVPDVAETEMPAEDAEKESEESAEEAVAQPEQAPRPPIQDPAFRSNQRKAAISGSIARTGTSSLDVADTPMGRYQAAISKAVEREWRENCVRHRDFITPGFLSVRFFVQEDGAVRSVNFVGTMHTGEVQKGFTLSSIRDAEIPKMPDAVRKELDGEPMELIFNFYF